jgi:membrane protein
MEKPPLAERLKSNGPIARAWRYVAQDLWRTEVSTLPRAKAALVRAFRVVVLAARGFTRDRIVMQAGSLTYVTVLSMVPLLAFSASLAKGFGAYDTLKQDTITPWLDDTFGELPPEVTEPGVATEGGDGGSQLRVAFEQILGFVEETDFAKIGSFGLFFLLYSALKLLSAIERSMNEIWAVKRPRTLARKVTDYVGLVVVAPVFLLTATAITAWFKAPAFQSVMENFPFVLRPILAALPYVSVGVGFCFVYLTVPNTRVRFGSALLGGILAGVLWQVLQYLHIEFQVGVAKYDAIFASFAAFPILLVWIFLSWVILFVGAEVACAHQNEPVFTSIIRTGTTDQAFREALALRLAGRAAGAFQSGEPAPTAIGMATELGVSPRVVLDALEALVAAELLVRATDGDEEGYLPSRDPSSITVLELLAALRRDAEVADLPVRGALDERVDRLLAGFDEFAASSPHNQTLAELSAARPQAPA